MRRIRVWVGMESKDNCSHPHPVLLLTHGHISYDQPQLPLKAKRKEEKQLLGVVDKADLLEILSMAIFSLSLPPLNFLVHGLSLNLLYRPCTRS